MGKINELVDRGFQLDTSIKKMEKELDGIKKTLKKHAKQYEKPEIQGNKSKAVVGPMSFTTADSQKLYSHLKDQGRESEFWTLVKVNVTNTNKALGETAMEEISKTTTLKYHKIQFKKS